MSSPSASPCSIRSAAGAVQVITDVVGWFSAAGPANTTVMDLKPGTVLGGPGEVISATGDAQTGATAVLAASADVPAVGGHLVLSAQSVVSSGLSGRVIAVAPTADGTRVTWRGRTCRTCSLT